MKRKWLVVTLVLFSYLFAGIVLAGVVLAQSLKWTAPTSYVDNTAIEPAVLDVMKFYLRTDEPNGVSVNPDATGKYYLATAPPRTSVWPADNDLAGFLRARGQEGKTLTFSVSAAYTDGNGVEHEGAPSAGYPWIVPFVPGKEPGRTTGVLVE